jgi:hypothetical protein
MHGRFDQGEALRLVPLVSDHVGCPECVTIAGVPVSLPVPLAFLVVGVPRLHPSRATGLARRSATITAKPVDMELV